MLTPESVRGLWSYMQSTYRTTTTDKRDSLEMQWLAKLLPTDGFDHYVTTLGRRIYTPFDIGTATERWTLPAQAAVCAHEHMHVHQSDRDPRYYTRYLLNSHWRAFYESEAYRATMEVKFFLGEPFYPEQIAEGLANYGCTGSDIMTARELLSQYAVTVRNGDVMTAGAQQVIFFLCR